MLNINNNAALRKQEILVKIAKLQLEGKLDEGVHFIPKETINTIKQRDLYILSIPNSTVETLTNSTQPKIFLM